MRDEKKKELDKLIRQNRQPPTKLMIYIAGLVLFLGVIAVVFFPTGLGTEYGTTVSVEPIKTDTGESEMAEVRLDSGALVKAVVSANLTFRPDARVELQTSSSMIGVASYRVMRYVE